MRSRRPQSIRKEMCYAGNDDAQLYMSNRGPRLGVNTHSASLKAGSGHEGKEKVTKPFPRELDFMPR